jgi:hypothetical protein
MKRVYLLALALTAVVFAAPGWAASGESPVALKASLNSKQQVPPPKYKAGSASGRFTGTLKEVGRKGAGELSWHLAFTKLSSPVTVAYLLVPPGAKNGQIVVQLCSRCASSSTGVTETLSADIAKAISTGKSYIVIGTKKNPAGEIRGRTTLTRG